MNTWLKGLLAAIITGAANAITTTLVAPETFNFGSGLNKLLTVAGVSALIGAATYLKQSPLPGDPPSSSSSTGIKIQLILAFLLPTILLSGCASDQVESNIPVIKSGVSIMTSGALSLAKATEKDRNDVFVVAVALRSLATGQVPDVSTLNTTLAQFVTNPIVKQYIVPAVSAFYASEYSKLNGDGKVAADLLEAIAEGVETGTGITPPASTAMRRLPPDIRIALWNFQHTGQPTVGGIGQSAWRDFSVSTVGSHDPLVIPSRR